MTRRMTKPPEPHLARVDHDTRRVAALAPWRLVGGGWGRASADQGRHPSQQRCRGVALAHGGPRPSTGGGAHFVGSSPPRGVEEVHEKVTVLRGLLGAVVCRGRSRLARRMHSGGRGATSGRSCRTKVRAPPPPVPASAPTACRRPNDIGPNLPIAEGGPTILSRPSSGPRSRRMQRANLQIARRRPRLRAGVRRGGGGVASVAHHFSRPDTPDEVRHLPSTPPLPGSRSARPGRRAVAPRADPRLAPRCGFNRGGAPVM